MASADGLGVGGAESGALERESGHVEMMTLFMPMAPNPVMGGFVIHADASRVVDVDMTVEQRIQSIVTSGVAFGEGDPGLDGLTAAKLRELGSIERVDGRVTPGRGVPNGNTPDGHAERVDVYDDGVSPEYADTPEDISRRARRTADGSHEDPNRTEATPAELAGRDADQREPTGSVTAERAGRADGTDSGNDTGARGEPVSGTEEAPDRPSDETRSGPDGGTDGEAE